MFQVIDRAPSIGDKFARAFANLGKASQAIPQQMIQQAAQAKQNAFLKQMGLEGLTDPELQKVALAQKLKTAGQKDVLQEQMAMLSGLGNGQAAGMQQGLEGTEQSQANPAEISDEQIARYALINPQVARILQAQKEAAQKARKAEEESNEKTFDKASGYQDEVLKDYNSYRRDTNILNQMMQLADKGNLPPPLLVQVMESLGVPLGAIKNPDSEQFSKLSQELVKNISGTYGNRILKVEVDNFLKSIPTLLNSDEGKKRLIRQWQIINEGKKVNYDAYREIEKENPTRLPRNFKFLVQDRADQKLDELSKEFQSIGIDQSRVKVPKGTIANIQVIDKYLDLAQDDVELAKKMAREDGYEF